MEEISEAGEGCFSVREQPGWLWFWEAVLPASTRVSQRWRGYQSKKLEEAGN